MAVHEPGTEAVHQGRAGRDSQPGQGPGVLSELAKSAGGHGSGYPLPPGRLAGRDRPGYRRLATLTWLTQTRLQGSPSRTIFNARGVAGDRRRAALAR